MRAALAGLIGLLGACTAGQEYRLPAANPILPTDAVQDEATALKLAMEKCPDLKNLGPPHSHGLIGDDWHFETGGNEGSSAKVRKSDGAVLDCMTWHFHAD